MRYLRSRAEGGTYFFTVVTYERRKILCATENTVLLQAVLKNVMGRHPFTMDAFVLLPDHLHCIWTLPEGDRDFSGRWRLIKGGFSRQCHVPATIAPTSSRQKKREQTIWQRRFWEHQILDDADFTKHVEYIHYNPVKHKLVQTPGDWPHSSFHRYVREGRYDGKWGGNKEIGFDQTQWGE